MTKVETWKHLFDRRAPHSRAGSRWRCSLFQGDVQGTNGDSTAAASCPLGARGRKPPNNQCSGPPGPKRPREKLKSAGGDARRKRIASHSPRSPSAFGYPACPPQPTLAHLVEHEGRVAAKPHEALVPESAPPPGGRDTVALQHGRRADLHAAVATTMGIVSENTRRRCYE